LSVASGQTGYIAGLGQDLDAQLTQPGFSEKRGEKKSFFGLNLLCVSLDARGSLWLASHAYLSVIRFRISERI